MTNEHREQAREIEMIRERLSELTGLCGDHSCVFGPPKGMGTNGGCRCEVKRNPKVQQAIQLQRRLITLLSARDQEIKEVLEGFLNSGVEFDDERIDYVVMQIDRRDLAAARELWEKVKDVAN